MKKIIATLGLLWGISFTYSLDNLSKSIQTATQEAAHSQPDLGKFWSQLKKNGVIEHTGNDADFRPLYVTMQGIVESVLANQSGLKVIGVIHTVLPPTPLRTQPEEITQNLVAPEISQDKNRSKTVSSRAVIVRRFLENSNNVLYACYEQGSLKKDVPGLSIYEDLVKKFTTLKDAPFVGSLPVDLSGATYLIQDSKGKKYCFGLLARQANAPTDSAHWVMVYGDTTNKKIKKHVRTLTSFLKEKNLNIFGDK